MTDPDVAPSRGSHSPDPEPESESSTVSSTPNEDAQLAETLSLRYEWCVWYDEWQHKSMNQAEYENSIRNLGNFANVQDFWRYWHTLSSDQVSRYPPGSNMRMFKAGIKPMWEDPANERGGKWVVACSKENTSNFWTKVVLAMIGDHFDAVEDLVRPIAFYCSCWRMKPWRTCTASTSDTFERVVNALQRAKQCPILWTKTMHIERLVRTTRFYKDAVHQ
eukprot:TRINITY_DN4859_c0_g1_i1.p1 TRINITY_DN4859_c0_g1~~TRINITY_DN4859_c0_g1_i1.p1  ORF type:complete len:220 (-),score=22.54 TRINITY_DN4859_c0_g1_i1:286-945(-)